MIFKTISELADAINNEIGNDFINQFQYGRKKIKNASRVSGSLLFGNLHDDDSWAINSGGNTEIQYHISFNETTIFYGLGFNAQYVQFKNDKTPVEYIRPFMNAFLLKQEEIKQMLPDYGFVAGNLNQLKKPSYGDFILYGKKAPIVAVDDAFELKDTDFKTILTDLKRQYPAYELIYKTRNQLSETLQQIDTYKALLNMKPQLILQGAPGTGKTFTAQEVAFQMIFDRPMGTSKEERQADLLKLSESPQYEFVQFHPAYSYEDFIRGISAKPSGQTVAYKAEDRTFAKFALTAYQNLQDSKKAPVDYTKEEWIQEMVVKFRNHLEEQVANSGTVQITDAAYIDRITDTTIRYRGDKWQIDGGVPYTDLKEMYLKEVRTLDDVRKLETLTLSAKGNSTYWLKILELFRVFIEGSGEQPPASPLPKVGKKPYIFIIDEINRANLPAVLGELIYALEYRDIPVKSIYELDDSENLIIIPSNLYIIGTMNTADRSIGHLDYAIRRRFAFADVYADEVVITYPKAKKLFNEVKKLFIDTDADKSYLSSEFEPNDVMPGHSYYLSNDDHILLLKLTYEILPILREYVRDGILSELPQEKIQLFHDALI